MRKCRFCDLEIEYDIERYAYTVVNSNTSADGLTYCPPNPDHSGPFGNHEPVPVQVPVPVHTPAYCKPCGGPCGLGELP